MPAGHGARRGRWGFSAAAAALLTPRPTPPAQDLQQVRLQALEEDDRPCSDRTGEGKLAGWLAGWPAGAPVPSAGRPPPPAGPRG